MTPLQFASLLLKHLTSITPGTPVGDFVFKEKTFDAYGSPGGSWNKHEGFRFQNHDFSLILRSIPQAGEGGNFSYVAIDSDTRRAQLANIQLNKPKAFRSEGGKTRLLESFTMTAGMGKVKEEMLKKALKEVGFKSDTIAALKDVQPDFNKAIEEILRWAVFREKAKTIILSRYTKPEDLPVKISKTGAPQSVSINTILYGPPGTGKTFNSINHALSILESISVEEILTSDRIEVKRRFDQFNDKGRIVFTTFHQSLSYEDFIEGIKPSTTHNGVVYQIEQGIFKKLCIDAAFAITQLTESTEAKKVLTFYQLYDQLVASIEETLSKEDASVFFPTKSGGQIKIEGISEQGNITVRHIDGTRSYVVSKERLAKLDQAIANLDDVSNIDTEFRQIIGGSNSSAYWAVLRTLRTLKPQESKSVYSTEDKLAAIKTLKRADYERKDLPPFVIIIDEINRGNISQIFGELITLIEEDKRLGCAEALEVTLPYSKDKFGVPPNVYIIGTMNTADRSVEALDTALRRRFSFEEVLPDPQLIGLHGKLKERSGTIDGIVLSELLIIINRRIEKLLDKDHLIGHSYFMGVADLNGLKLAFQNKINPLLQEYFYGDFGKIGLVLGQSFFEENTIKSDSTNIFAPFPDYDPSDYFDRNTYRLKDVFLMSDQDFIDALQKLMLK